MHVSADTRGRRPRNRAFVLVALVALLAVVAIASSGHVPSGTDHTRRPAHEIADTLLSLLVVFVVAGGLVSFCVYYLQRTNSHEDRRQGRGRRSRRAVVPAIVLALLVGLAVRTVIHRNGHRGAGPGGGLPTGLEGGKGTGYTPRFAPVPVAVVLGAAAVAALAAYLAHRARRGALRPLALEPLPAQTLADVLGETLDDLRAERDPRIAVIAAYARLERTLTAVGVRRRESDAPLEYLRRILVDLDVGSADASRLTALFEHAKFSTREVGPEMKEEAIAVLESIRDDLQATQAARPPVQPGHGAGR